MSDESDSSGEDDSCGADELFEDVGPGCYRGRSGQVRWRYPNRRNGRVVAQGRPIRGKGRSQGWQAIARGVLPEHWDSQRHREAKQRENGEQTPTAPGHAVTWDECLLGGIWETKSSLSAH